MRINELSKTDFDRAKIKLTGHFDRRPTSRYFEPWVRMIRTILARYNLVPHVARIQEVIIMPPDTHENHDKSTSQSFEIAMLVV